MKSSTKIAVAAIYSIILLVTVVIGYNKRSDWSARQSYLVQLSYEQDLDKEMLLYGDYPNQVIARKLVEKHCELKNIEPIKLECTNGLIVSIKEKHYVYDSSPEFNKSLHEFKLMKLVDGSEPILVYSKFFKVDGPESQSIQYFLIQLSERLKKREKANLIKVYEDLVSGK